MFHIMNCGFGKAEYVEKEYLKNWPMLYILENGEKAYIGQSNHVLTRMKEHEKTPEKQLFDQTHFIYSREFNQSVTIDYEARLIGLIAADEQYRVTNKNDGIADKKYYNKEYYDGQFPKLWEKLRKANLARHTIDEIENSDLFKYSPYKELNDDQREAVNGILAGVWENDGNPVIVSGMPGSGKTIVAVFLLKFLKDDERFRDKKIGIVIPQTSLRKTLRQIFRNIEGLKASDVLSPSDVVKEKYDILLVDEAHRLHRRKNISYMGTFDKNTGKLGLPADSDELDWIMAQCSCPVLFYDSRQVVGPSGITLEAFREKFDRKYGGRMVTYYMLLSQMRVRGGNDYINYVTALLSDTVAEKKTFPHYEFFLVEHFDKFNRLLLKKEAEQGLARMVAGYAWEWKSKKHRQEYDMELEGIQKRWNNRTEGWVHCDTALEEVGCIHSIQGYDLNYAFVILGNDIYYDQEQRQIRIDPASYFDKNGKRTASYEELLGYIRNIYYVLLTRGIKGTYLYVCDEGLREHLKQYIEVCKEPAE